jgi:hypothetical protein
MSRAVEPREPPGSDSDPWVLGYEALLALGRVRQSVRHHDVAMPDLERAEELIRQLATGPQD